MPFGRATGLAAPTLAEEELLAAQGKASIMEGWLSLTTYRAPAERSELYVRLFPDALAFYDIPGGSGAAPVPEQKRLETPTEVVLFSKVKSMLGRSAGSKRVKISDLMDRWWELPNDNPEELERWRAPLAARVEHFRTCSKRSVKVRRATQLLAAVDVALAQKASMEQSWLRRLAKTCARLCGGSEGEADFSSLVSKQTTPFRGKRLSCSENARSEKLTSDVDLQEAQAAHWSNEAIQFLTVCKTLPEALEGQFKLTVRKGVPDGLKHQIWAYAAGCPEAQSRDGEAERIYKNTLRRAFGGVVPDNFREPVPTFCQGLSEQDAPLLKDAVRHLEYLNPDGDVCLRRLLWVIQLTTHSVELCPFLPNFVATLLLFFTEGETMCIVGKIIGNIEKERIADKMSNPGLILNRKMLMKQSKLFLKEGKKKLAAQKALEHLEKLGLDTNEVAMKLLQDGLVSTLPFRGFCRLVGSVLAEGSNAIVHYALAVVKMQTPAILQCSTAEQATELLANLGKTVSDSVESLDSLTKHAWSMRFASAGVGAMSSIYMPAFMESSAAKRHIFCRPRLFEPRGNAPDDMWEEIWSWVPESCRIFDPQMIYLPGTHGTSSRTCLDLCKKHEDAPMIFFVYTEKGDIMGGFAPAVWRRTSGAGWVDLLSLIRGAEDSFVFRKLSGQGSETEVFPWTGNNRMLYQASELHGFVFGSEKAAISIDKDLVRGATAPCETFGSPALLADSASPASPGKRAIDFEVTRFEVFALL
eukprot:TRINITY_DN54193_c0_g1_i1.p1 TRINITY_DN54193_c0_g1~~TRINITY_DN54193_c0_g1_i1.p1  ORF type:complete len:755 (-),score=167.31 TRINITY_DN54193_c0_g1_i1:90-2354(-)